MKINEVEKKLNISSYTLRYYEKMNLIKVKRDENGYRHYDEQDIKTLNEIRFLRELEIPIEEIQAIIHGEKTFQDILQDHITKIDSEMQSLQAIKELCEMLNAQQLPLLEDIVENHLPRDQRQRHHLKQLIQKIFAYFHSSQTVVIGQRTTIKDFLGYLPLGIIYSVFIGALLGIGLPHGLHNLNESVMSSTSQIHIPTFEISVAGIIMLMIIIFVLMTLMILRNISKQNYIELSDNHIVICSYHYQSRKGILKSLFLKKDNAENKVYQWSDLDRVEIELYFQSMTGYKGLWTIYVPEFHFVFNDGFVYKIVSGISFGEDTRTAYSILRCKNIEIYASDEVVGYFEQKELKGYDYFEKIYHKNSRKS